MEFLLLGSTNSFSEQPGCFCAVDSAVRAEFVKQGCGFSTEVLRVCGVSPCSSDGCSLRHVAEAVCFLARGSLFLFLTLRIQLMKEDPSFVPRGSSYFLHDDRGGTSQNDDESEEERREGRTRAFADDGSDFDDRLRDDEIPRSTQTR